MKKVCARIPLAAALLAVALWAQRPAITSQGTFTLIDFPDAASTQVWGVNSRGEMVGVYVDSANVSHGFLYSRGHGRPLGPERNGQQRRSERNTSANLFHE